MTSSIDTITVIAFLSINIGLASLIAAFILWLDGDIKSVGNKIDSDMKAQTQRTDQLYQMFIDLLESQKPKTDFPRR